MTDESQENGTKAETTPESKEIHRVLREEGSKEIRRHSGAVAWSGLAAGLSMGFSFLTMAVMEAALPDAGWQRLVSGFGYSLGFLIVVLGRQQLFTESTLTAILPILSERSLRQAPRLLRFWAVVLVANLVGTGLFGWLLSYEHLYGPEISAALEKIALGALKDPFWPMLTKAVLAGWLIALMVWLLPSAGSAKMLVIVALTYVVAISHFSHVIAGSVETSFAVFIGAISPLEYLTGFLAPTLIGNTIGGVALVAILNHAPLATEA